MVTKFTNATASKTPIFYPKQMVCPCLIHENKEDI